jgi:hypothetical protein
MTPQNYLISVIGPHAGETMEEIFKRKIDDIKRVGYTYWLQKSYKATPNNILSFLENNSPVTCLFLNPKSKGGVNPTKVSQQASRYSLDNLSWIPLNEDVSPVTGKLPASALVFSNINLVSETIDLNEYVDYLTGQKVAPKIGASTLGITPGLLEGVGNTQNLREVVAYATVTSPYVVWVG